MKAIAKLLITYILGIIGIILIGSSSYLFLGEPFLDLQLYITTLMKVTENLFTPSAWMILHFVPYSIERGSISFADFLSGPYLYSIKILLSSLILSILVAQILSLITMRANLHMKRVFLQISKLLESFPDFSYVFIIQIVVVQVFLSTNVLILKFYSLGDNQIFLAPIFCLSILPTLMFFKLFILLYEEEWTQSYVELVRSKGLNNAEILWKHCTPNVMRSVFLQSKSIVWLTLSSLLIIEYLFGIHGIIYYLLNGYNPESTTFILIAIFTPFFIFYSIAEQLLDKGQNDSNTIFEKTNLLLVDFKQHKFYRNQSTSINIPAVIKKGWSSAFKRLRITIPILIVLGLFLTSLFYSIFFNDHINQINFIYNEDDSIVSRAPHPPYSDAFFGTDPYGYSILQQLLVGIKYTILITLLIATIRIIAGYIFGTIYVFYFNQKLKRALNSIADGMHYLPLTMIAFIILFPILRNLGVEWNTTLTERLALQVLIMSLIVLPITASQIGNEMNETLKKEYVQNSVVMGGSIMWILTKHINPQLWSKLLLFWTQHVIQVLQMFVHLGVLSVFVGGASNDEDSSRLIPEIYELSGMIAISREVFMTKQYWMIIPPLFIFMMLIYCFNTIVEEISQKPKIHWKKRRERLSKSSSLSEVSEPLINSASFIRIKEIQHYKNEE